jgi:hypothetical protein
MFLLVGSNACLVRRAGTGQIADPSVISETELDSVHAGSALEAVRQLRPMFLVSRGKLSPDPRVPPALPNVYVDNQFYGDATVLRNISAESIESIKFFNPAEAQLKFGTGNPAGVIGIFTKH